MLASVASGVGERQATRRRLHVPLTHYSRRMGPWWEVTSATVAAWSSLCVQRVVKAIALWTNPTSSVSLIASVSHA